MSQRGRPPALAGVSLCPDRAHAVVVQGDTVRDVEPVEPVEPVATATGPWRELLRRCVRAADGGAGALRAVTVDLSPLLLAAVAADDATLPRTGMVRIVPRPASDPVLAATSPPLERFVAQRYTVRGGHDVLGAELAPLQGADIEAVCADLRARGLDTVALVGAGSQAQPAHEREVADAVLAAVPSARVTTAGDYGGHGLLAREATALLDAVLGVLVDRLLEEAERALAALAPRAALRVARGDGGSCAPFYARALPCIGLGAQDGLALAGAAHLAGHADCRVVLDGVTGEVRGGLPVIRSSETAGALRVLGTALAVPTAVLVRGHVPPPPQGLPVTAPDAPAVRLACVGAAVSRPTSWLDEVGHIDTAAELARFRQRLEHRARAIVLANGAAPGSPQVADESAVAMPYSPSGTVRVRVRVVGALETPGEP